MTSRNSSSIDEQIKTEYQELTVFIDQLLVDISTINEQEMKLTYIRLAKQLLSSLPKINNKMEI
jgi:hypothetical protein